jgi:hypothetical protein
MPLGYPNDHMRKPSRNPYGASQVASRRNSDDTAHIQTATTQGDRLALASAAVKNMGTL